MTSHLQPIREQVLATRGVGGYRQYRIPALAVTRTGTLLAAYDGRPNLDDLPNPIDLLLRRSFDSGQTWTDQQVVRSGVGLQGFGDPSLLVDSHTGRIFMFHAAGTHAGFFEAVEGLSRTMQSSTQTSASPTMTAAPGGTAGSPTNLKSRASPAFSPPPVKASRSTPAPSPAAWCSSLSFW